jgi:hypothetical protein
MNSFEGQLYRAALSLFPGDFRRDHGAEMSRDFDEAREEAADSSSAVWLLRCCMAIDLVRTFAVQWVRTGLPVIAIASILLPLVIAEGVATAVRSMRVRIPDGVDHAEMVVVLFMVEISVVLIAMTIFVSLWVGRLMQSRRR